jgi:hypothetical protein
MPPDGVECRLSDGTSLIVPAVDLRPVYDALWDLSGRTGAISTAVLLIDEARRPNRYRQPVELNPSQSNVLKQVIDGFATSS